MTVVSRWFVMPMAAIAAAVTPAVVEYVVRDAALRLPDRFRVVLHPTGLREELRELPLPRRDDLPIMIEEDRPRTRRPLVERENVPLRGGLRTKD